MAIGGLVLSLSQEPGLRRDAEDRLAMDPRLEIGPRHGPRVAVVATTDTLGEGRDLCESLIAHPGIDTLEVAYVADEDQVPATDEQGDV